MATRRSNTDDITLDEALQVLTQVSELVPRLLAVVQKAVDQQEEVRKRTPIYHSVPSNSRSGISHAVVFSSGCVRCSCESATFRPERGECVHVRTCKESGVIPSDAHFLGGLIIH